MADDGFSRRTLLEMGGAAAAAYLIGAPARAQGRPNIAPQPFFASVKRALAALASAGQPISDDDAKRIEAFANKSDPDSVAAADALLGKYTVANVRLEADGYARTTPGDAPKALVEQGWTAFLIRVENPLASTAELKVTGANKLTFWTQSTAASRSGLWDTVELGPIIKQVWFRNELYQKAPLGPTLSGAPVEYRILQIYSRDRGSHEMDIDFFVASQDYAEWRAPLLRRGGHFKFACASSSDAVFQIRDHDGRGCMASLTITDRSGRVYPFQPMRLAPDMVFHKQVYRADGETVRLPDGEYIIESRRGPEYLPGKQVVRLNEANRQVRIQLARWIDPAKWGWYSGDTHIHAGGCSHYDHPTEGVSPETMIRHVRGEGLSIGDVLTWGPSWYYQKQFFTGAAVSPQATLEHPDLQAADNASLVPKDTPQDAESTLRYDVEVSGFPSSHCGHLVLLRLKEQDYPGTKLIEDWPSWNLPILKWAKAQGALVGVAHCGWGMQVASNALPNYDIPPMDGIGTQEAIVDITHGVTDFLSGVDTVPAAELNAWYHLLNCGFRLAMVGETDYPCITDFRVGLGRSYVQLPKRPIGNDGYEAWIKGIAQGQLYFGDGKSHFLDWTVDNRRSGDADVKLPRPKTVTVKALVAARLETTPTEPLNLMWPDAVWDIEKARIGTSSEVAVELIVNGQAVEQQRLLADGRPRSLTFNTKIERSSWIALRILPSGHTHPIFVEVEGKPVRASKRSAEWCRRCVDKLWEVKSPQIRASERAAAAEAYDHARTVYDRIIAECEVA